MVEAGVGGLEEPGTSPMATARRLPLAMAARIAGVLAVVGGAAWLVKFVLIWENGGTNTTEGLVGVLFDVGAVAILLALGVRAWWAPIRGIPRNRPLAVLVVMVAFAAAVNLPILLGWTLFGRTWLAEEVGVLLTAIAAVVLGCRWATAERGEARTTTT
jgi:hypothetical protein